MIAPRPLTVEEERDFYKAALQRLANGECDGDLTYCDVIAEAALRGEVAEWLLGHEPGGRVANARAWIKP